MEDTAYLLRSPKNAQRLLKSVGQLEAGREKARKLVE
jgi:antitoxin YefM